MSTLFAILVGLATLCFHAIAVSGDKVGLRIVSGYETESLSIAPHQVSLRLKPDSHFCGGSIITNWWILSAAHCVDGQTADQIVAVVGTLYLDQGGDRYDIALIIAHELYMPTIIRNDIAMLKVDKEFLADAPYKSITRGDSTILGGVELRLTGWGLTSNPGNLSNHLMSMDTKSITNWDCTIRLVGNVGPPVSLLANKNICTENTKGEGACYGDSGGPLVEKKKGSLVGIVSWGLPCARDGKPDIYTRVYAFKDWIDQHIQNN